jgi:hypothetical protein
VPPWSTFPQAPLRSRTVGFPHSGADRGRSSVACPYRAKLQGCLPYAPARSGVLPRALPGSPGPPLSEYAWSCPVPSAPGPGHGVPRHAMMSGTRSAGMPPPSSLLRAQAPVRPLRGPRGYPHHPVCAGCCQPRRGAGPSRRSLCAAVPPCVAPSPGGACGARTRVCPPDSGLPLGRTGSALHHVRAATAARRPLRGCSPSRMCRPAGVLTTLVAPTATVATGGQPWF